MFYSSTPVSFNVLFAVIESNFLEILQLQIKLLIDWVLVVYVEL